jgi:hypothetical protein
MIPPDILLTKKRHPREGGDLPNIAVMRKLTVDIASFVVLGDYRFRGNDGKLLKRTALRLRGDDK